MVSGESMTVFGEAEGMTKIKDVYGSQRTRLGVYKYCDRSALENEYISIIIIIIIIIVITNILVIIIIIFSVLCYCGQAISSLTDRTLSLMRNLQ